MVTFSDSCPLTVDTVVMPDDWVCTARVKVHNHVPGTACSLLSCRCNLESATAALENTVERLSGCRLLCISHFEGVKWGVCCVYFVTQRFRKALRSRRMEQISLLDKCSALRGPGAFNCALGWHSSAGWPAQVPWLNTLIPEPSAALGLFLDLVENTWSNTQERKGTAARRLLSQISCPQNPAHSSSGHQASNSRARSQVPVLHFPSLCSENTSAWV